MTGRTHDIAALTFFHLIFIVTPMLQVSFVTLVCCVCMVMLGGITPDIDQPTSKLWNNIPAGSIIGRIVHPFLGGHRLISHSLIGMGVAGILLQLILTYLSHYLKADMSLVWWSFIIGMFSHLVMDTCTKEGIPWFFPFPLHIGFPPVKQLRIRTGGIIEKLFLFPGFFLFNGYLIYHHYHLYVTFVQQYLKF